VTGQVPRSTGSTTEPYRAGSRRGPDSGRSVDNLPDGAVAFARQAGLEAPEWRLPDQSGFFQPLLLARVPAAPG
jgi:hypothetical protein